MKTSNYITSLGYGSLQEKNTRLHAEYKELMEEMQEVKSNCLSTDDSSELNQYRMMLDSLSEQISDTREFLESSTIIDLEKITTSRAIFGTVVTIENIETGDLSTYRLVSTVESSPKDGRISIDSPLGRAIKGSEVGDVVDFNSPSGISEFEIINIDK